MARKVFRGAAALTAHEQSEHYTRWQASALPPGAVKARETRHYDTLLPRSAAYPFRKGW